MNNGNPHDKLPPYPKPNGPDSQYRVEAAPSGTMSRESWKIFQVMAEFVAGFEQLAQIQPSVSIFGSARTPPPTARGSWAKRSTTRWGACGTA